MRPPEELYSIHSEPSSVDGPVLVYAFAGFVDAGAGVRLAADHLLASCEHRLIATFDVDEVFDYRARRPRMSYVVDHFASVEIPQITLHEVTDSSGVPFLLLVGPEPDYQWQRFIAAVEQIVDRFGIRLAIGLTAVPWPAPIPVRSALPCTEASHRSLRTTRQSLARSRCPGMCRQCSNYVSVSAAPPQWGSPRRFRTTSSSSSIRMLPPHCLTASRPSLP